ncbi:hypothetical protein IWX49DRAFT_78388 [Phyllosticta citricarpa]|uniref:Uncharacterized protein n=2 Tax=Phyllosticta TaxID=121621 RepID=A0ABR1LRY8_9PEZI
MICHIEACGFATLGLERPFMILQPCRGVAKLLSLNCNCPLRCETLAWTTGTFTCSPIRLHVSRLKVSKRRLAKRCGLLVVSYSGCVSPSEKEIFASRPVPEIPLWNHTVSASRNLGRLSNRCLFSCSHLNRTKDLILAARQSDMHIRKSFEKNRRLRDQLVSLAGQWPR